MCFEERGFSRREFFARIKVRVHEFWDLVCAGLEWKRRGCRGSGQESQGGDMARFPQGQSPPGDQVKDATTRFDAWGVVKSVEIWWMQERPWMAFAEEQGREGNENAP